MIVFDREKNILDTIFAGRDIISGKDIARNIKTKEKTSELEKEFLDFSVGKLFELIRDNSYGIEMDGKEYFFRDEELKSQFESLAPAVKEFFNDDSAEYAEYKLLKRYKADENERLYNLCKNLTNI